MGIHVTVRQVPGTSKTIELDEGSTVQDLMAVVGATERASARINHGDVAPSDTLLEDGDTALVTENVAGA